MNFTVTPPDGTIPTNDLNWRNFAQNFSSGTWNPLPASGGPALGTGLATQTYYEQLMGNLIFFNILLKTGTGSPTWATGTYVKLPKALGITSGAIASNEPMYTLAPLLTLTGTLMGWLTIQPTANIAPATIINNGSTITLSASTVYVLNGYYFTGK